MPKLHHHRLIMVCLWQQVILNHNVKVKKDYNVIYDNN